MTVLAELKKPFNLLSTAIAVLSLLLSVHFYLESLQRREPYYLAYQSAQIYNKAVASPKITVIDSAGKPVSGDIHVLEVSFWNNGKLPIEPSEVRTPIIFEFPDGYRLLESKVVRENKPAITSFTLFELPISEASSPRVKLEWTHLDPGLGARLQFIYVGEANPELKINWNILDAEIKNGSGLLKRMLPESVRVIFLMVLCAVAIILVESIEVKQTLNRSKRFVLVSALVKLLIILGCLTLVFWLVAIPKIAPI